MSIAKVIEINASSKKSFEAAVQEGIKQASKTVKNITGAWVQDHKVIVSKGKVTEWRVNMKVTFIVK